jgi:hypothetical protein
MCTAVANSDFEADRKIALSLSQYTPCLECYEDIN